MEFIDTHSHNSDSVYGKDSDCVIARAKAAGVTKILQADTSEDDRKITFPLCRKYPGTLYPMLGLYPEYAREDWRDKVDELEKWIGENPVAIGEIGLDYHTDGYLRECQMAALEAQLEIASSLDLPVNIHLREATEDFFSVMERTSGLHLRGDIHAFGGSFETFSRLQKYGEWYVGIGGIVTFKNAGIAREIRKIPLERIVLETDSPYLAPVPLRGSRNESANIPLIAAKIAEIKGIGIGEVANATTKNAKELFQLLAF